ncbi:armadillo-type protein [Haematococcus lacustris]
MTTDSYENDYLARLTVKRLAELNKTRAKVESLERRASLLAEHEVERRRQDLLDSLSERYRELGPQLRDMSHHVAELKAYLQSVYDADLLGDGPLQDLAAEHCVGYVTRLLDLLAEPSKAASKGAAGVMELASSTLAMLAGRAPVAGLMHAAGSLSVMVKLLSPLFPTVVVVNVSNAVGNLAPDAPCRLAFRAAGGVGVLVRLLRSDVDTTAQTAAAAALSLLAARDVVIQDSVRYLGGIELLVELLASPDTYLAEVARYALLALRHGNVKNQAEIITSVRGSSALVKDLRRLDAASELLRFEDGTPVKAPSRAHAASLPLTSAGEVRNLIHEMTAHAPRSPTRSPLRPRTASSSTTTPLRPLDPVTPQKPLLTRDYALNSLTPGRDSLRTPRRSASPLARGTGASSFLSTPQSPAEVDWKISALVEVESELLRKKHLSRFTVDELGLLLEQMGFDSLDLRGFRVHRVSGAALLEMSEEDMTIDLVLPRSKVRKLRSLQRAARLFDAIATLPRQGKISEVELRLFLAGQGAGPADVNKVVKLFKTLVRVDKYDFVTFWDFVTSYDWISQALRIYNVPA